MNIQMAGLDYSKASIALRERLSFTKGGVVEALGQMKTHPQVAGVVLISTCNRTEVYVSGEGELPHPGELLCQVAGADYASFASAFVVREQEDCVNHLLAVSCGLKSQILGEDQILTQVKAAATLAQEATTLEPTLATLFRTAAACGKAVKTQVRFTTVATSAAHSGVLALEGHFGALAGKKALVIGNGEMGRLSADLLIAKGVQVWVTLRTYRHGETIVPRGCQVVDYQERYQMMPQVDMVISATTSPHHTVELEPLQGGTPVPAMLVDLAIPRDIDPGCSQVTQVLNVDDLGNHTGLDADTQAQVEALMATHRERFYHWVQYRDCMPAVEALKEAVAGRMQTPEARQAALKTVDMLMGGFAENITPEAIYHCASGIRHRTR